MNITTKLDNISDNLISDYLKSLGITNIKRFLKPTETCFEDPWNYPNMANACEILNFYIKILQYYKNQCKIFIEQDGVDMATMATYFIDKKCVKLESQ